MLRTIVMALAIALSHGETPWEYLFPDECQGAKYMLSYHANNITTGMGDVTYGEIMEYCEEKCGPGSCDDIQYHDLPDDSHCDRLKYGDLNEKYRNDVLDRDNKIERDAMIRAVNVMCGNIEIECASAINSLSNSYNFNQLLETDYTFVENPWGNSFYKIYNEHYGYDDAKAQCESDGAFLAIPRSAAENEFISDLILKYGIGSIWIGINDIEQEGLFVGVDGSEISWTNWNPGEPNNAGWGQEYGEDGVELWASDILVFEIFAGGWNDADQGHSKPFVCSINIGEKFTSLDDFETELNLNQENCEAICDGAMLDQGIDKYTDPCNSFSDEDHWDHWDDEDHWDHWDDDDHWDHWNHDDHWDHWDHDDHGQGNDLWNILIQDECQEAKWALANLENDFIIIDVDHIDNYNVDDVIDNCERQCRDSTSSCHPLEPDDFLNHETCHRIIEGDLRETYEHLVINAPNSDDRDKMMAVVNVMCGNVEIECAYAALPTFNVLRDESNIFEQKGDLPWDLPGDLLLDRCFDKCAGQMWDEGFDDMVDPCASSIIHSLSITIILIISLVR